MSTPILPAHPLPMVHTNGTGAETLLDGYRAASAAVRAARETIRQIEFNARDYYVIDDNAWTLARNARQVMQSALLEFENDLMDHAIVASDARKAEGQEDDS